jgi:catalase
MDLTTIQTLLANRDRIPKQKNPDSWFPEKLGVTRMTILMMTSYRLGELYRKVMSKKDRDHRIGNIVTHLSGALKRFQLRQTALFLKADEEYGQCVAEGLKLDMKKVERLAAMSQEERVKATVD